MTINFFRLIGKLFADELKPDAEDMNSIEDEDAELLAISESKSEVKLVNRLFRKSRDLRRAQVFRLNTDFKNQLGPKICCFFRKFGRLNE